MQDDQFERLYAKHGPALFAFLIYRTGDRALAEDVLADTFERALRARRPFDRRRATEKTWLYTIALNRLRDHLRRQAVDSRVLEHSIAETQTAGGGSPLELEGSERRGDLHRALMSLSPEEREAVALRYGADLTVPEVAKLTQEPLSTVKGRVYRALRKLREELS
jgi:RNA polymerase sigma factor (sigma-70 family)